MKRDWVQGCCSGGSYKAVGALPLGVVDEPFDWQDASCPKCNEQLQTMDAVEDLPVVLAQDETRLGLDIQYVRGETVTTTGGESITTPERLKITCNCCGYAWLQTPADG